MANRQRAPERENPRLRVELGSRVDCTDGRFGTLVDVVVDPARRSVTHLVVEPRRGPRSARLVPVEFAERTDERTRAIALRLSKEEVHALRPVDEVAYVRLDDYPVDDPAWDVGTEDVLSLAYYPAHDPRAATIRARVGVQPHGDVDPPPVDFALAYDRVPKGDVEIRGASSVTSSDGHEVGHADGFLVDRDDRITHVVLERGHLWGQREVTIPIGAVAELENDAVTLRLTKEEVGMLPAVPVERRPPARRRSVNRVVAALVPHPRVALGLGSANLAGAVYGTIVATAVVLGLDEASVAPARAFWILVGSGVFFWAAHVYAELVAHRLRARQPMARGEVVGVLRREWPLFQATFPLAVPLALGALGAISPHGARDLAAYVGVATLAVWGAAIARRERCSGAATVGAAVANATVGLALVALKLALG